MLKSDFHRVDENGSQQLSRYFGIAAAGFSLFLAKTVTIFRSIVLVMSRAAGNFFFHFQRSRIHHKGFWDKRQLLKMSFHASQAAQVSSLATGLHFCQFFSILASFFALRYWLCHRARLIQCTKLCSPAAAYGWWLPQLMPIHLREEDSPMTHKSGRIWRWEDEAVASEKPNCTLSEKINLLI